MNTFNNLPGHYVYRDDGGLSVLNTLPGDVTLVLGTAPEGPQGVYFVENTQQAVAAYGGDVSKGNLLKGMFQALTGGAKNVALYRIGASPYVIDFINGFTIVVTGDIADYSLYMNASAGIFRVIDKDGNTKYDRLTGVTSPDVYVFGEFVDTSDTAKIGTSTTPVSLNSFSTPVLSTLNYPDFHSISYESYTAATRQLVLTTEDSSVIAGSVFKSGNDYLLVDYVVGAVATISASWNDTKKTWGTDLSATTDVAVASSGRALPRFVDAKDGMNMTLNETYLALERAYWELETANVDVVVPMDVYIDSPNIKNNEGVVSIPSGDYLALAYKFTTEEQVYMAFDTKGDGSGVILPTPYEIGIDGYAAKAWKEGTHKFETAIAATSQADIDAMADDIVFHEINFAHQLATYCYLLSTNDNSASGVIGFVPFQSAYRTVVGSWLGRLPLRDSDDNTVKSGSGVLGNKLLSGSIGVTRGIYLTDDGLYGGTALINLRTKSAMDIGYYIDVVSTPLRFLYKGLTPGTGSIESAAAVYAGILNSIDKNVPVMRKKANASYYNVVYDFTKSDLDKLIEARTVAFKAGNDTLRTPTIVDSPSASLPTSDYKSRFSSRVVAGVIDVVRSVADPFIGAISSPSSINNLQETINSALFQLQQPGPGQYLVAGSAQVRQTAQQRIDGEAVVKLILKIPGELRRIETYIMLTR